MSHAVSQTVAKYADAVEALRDFTKSAETKPALNQLGEKLRQDNIKAHGANVVEAKPAG